MHLQVSINCCILLMGMCRNSVQNKHDLNIKHTKIFIIIINKFQNIYTGSEIFIKVTLISIITNMYFWKRTMYICNIQQLTEDQFCKTTLHLFQPTSSVHQVNTSPSSFFLLIEASFCIHFASLSSGSEYNCNNKTYQDYNISQTS